MDKFITHAPTWKTKNYSQIAASNSGMGGAKFDKVQNVQRSKPLHEKQQPNGRKGRLSIRDEQLLQIFAASPDQPLLPVAADRNAYSEISLSGGNDNFTSGFGRLRIASDENSKPHTTSSPALAQKYKNDSCNLSDYAICTKKPTTRNNISINANKLNVDKVNDSPAAAYLAQEIMEGNELPCTPVNQLLQSQSPITPKNNPIMERIQRDLNSPSAMVRLRALKALKSPSKSCYAQFDVPHEEQSIITAEERRTPPPLPSIEDLMRNVVVYVEVRTGEDNRSTGVKKVISALGAKVHDKLLRGTTHVIFKDGLLSTYKKAKNWNIPIVSILWIEACKNKRIICDPNDFPISNIDRYENPELYDKMKRHKSMQPDSECNKRVRAKTGTPKDSTPKAPSITATGLRKTSTIIGGTPNSPHSKKKTDISHFFKPLGSNRKINKLNAETPTPITVADALITESPATQLLNRMNTNSYTPILSVSMKPKEIASVDKQNVKQLKGTHAAAEETPKQVNTRRSLNYNAANLANDDNKVTPKAATGISDKRTTNRRRNSLYATSEITKNTIVDMSLSQTPIGTKTAAANDGNTPLTSSTRTTRRRSSMHVMTNMTLASNTADTNSRLRQAVQSDFTAITEEEIVSEKLAEQANEALNTRTPRKRSTYTSKTIETTSVEMQTSTAKTPIQRDIVDTQTNKRNVAQRRRTLYTPQKMEQSLEQTNRTKYSECGNITWRASNVASSTLISESTTPTTVTATAASTTPAQEMAGTLLEEHATKLLFSSTRQPGRRRTLFDVSLDIITQRLENINQSAARRSMAMTALPIANDLDVVDRNSFDRETPQLIKSHTSPNLTTPKAVQQTAADTVECDDTQIAEKSKENAKATDNKTTATNEPITQIVKKRKLFMPNDSLLQLTPTRSTMPVTPTTNSKRRKTLMPLIQPQSETKLSSASTSSKNSSTRPARRSTMDFETIAKAKTTLANRKSSALATTSTTKSITSSCAIAGVHKNDANAQKVNVTKVPFMVCTNMHKEQIEVIREVGTQH